MQGRRTDRLNSLLKEVLSEVIREDVKNPHISTLITVTKVEITSDLRHAKVFISIIGNEEVKIQTLAALQSASGFIAVNASKKVVMRYFPELTFRIDDSAEKQQKLDSLIFKIQKEREERERNSPHADTEFEDTL